MIDIMVEGGELSAKPRSDVSRYLDNTMLLGQQIIAARTRYPEPEVIAMLTTRNSVFWRVDSSGSARQAAPHGRRLIRQSRSASSLVRGRRPGRRDGAAYRAKSGRTHPGPDDRDSRKQAGCGRHDWRGRGGQSEPDGYTLLLGNTSTLVISSVVYRMLNYDPTKTSPGGACSERTAGTDCGPPGTAGEIGARADRAAKLTPGKLRLPSAGIGTPPHLIGETFKQNAGVDIVHVPYKGGELALQVRGRGRTARSPSTAPGPSSLPWLTPARAWALA